MPGSAASREKVWCARQNEPSRWSSCALPPRNRGRTFSRRSWKSGAKAGEFLLRLGEIAALPDTFGIGTNAWPVSAEPAADLSPRRRAPSCPTYPLPTTVPDLPTTEEAPGGLRLRYQTPGAWAASSGACRRGHDGAGHTLCAGVQSMDGTHRADGVYSRGESPGFGCGCRGRRCCDTPSGSSRRRCSSYRPASPGWSPCPVSPRSANLAPLPVAASGCRHGRHGQTSWRRS
jgi:hypothetical protein